jgi:hypothetical protein
MAEPHKSRVGFEDTLNFTNSLCVAYTLCSAVVRGWIRRDIYGIDDVVVAAATITTLGFFAANYVALDYGAGKPWDYIDAGEDVVPFNQVCLFSQDKGDALFQFTANTQRLPWPRSYSSHFHCICPRAASLLSFYASPKTAARSCYIEPA